MLDKLILYKFLVAIYIGPLRFYWRGTGGASKIGIMRLVTTAVHNFWCVDNWLYNNNNISKINPTHSDYKARIFLLGSPDRIYILIRAYVSVLIFGCANDDNDLLGSNTKKKGLFLSFVFLS